MTTLSPKPSPFKRARFHPSSHLQQHHLPAPIRSPADVFYTGTTASTSTGRTIDVNANSNATGAGVGVGRTRGLGGSVVGTGRQVGMSDLARRSVVGGLTGSAKVQDQNDGLVEKAGSGSVSTSTSMGGLKGIAGLEAKRSKMAFAEGAGTGTGTTSGNVSLTSVQSPFGNSVNGSKSVPVLNGSSKNGASTSTPRPSLTTSRSMTLEPARHRTTIPDPFPTPDVFYDPPTGSVKSTHQASPFLSTRSQVRPGGPATGTPFFKPPAPPSQSKRSGTPILPHAKPSTSTRSVLHTLPQPGITNLHLNGTGSNAVAGPSANKRRKTETGTIPVQTLPPPSASQQQAQAQAQRAKDESHADYKNKYTKAFPSFVFCFDAEFLMNQNKRGAAGEKGYSVKDCKEGIRRMGGQIEDFLSRRITHYISNRGVPSELERMMADSARRVIGPDGKEKTQPAMAAKVWNLQKLGNILEYLLRNTHVAPVAPIRGEDDLSYLLEDERLHGTRERDKAAPRADWYYFPKGVHYLLIDDATGESRSIMAKEFPKHRPGEPTPWPVIHETFMRMSETAKMNTDTAKQLREKAWKTWVTRERTELESSRVKGSALFDEHAKNTGMLTRSTSLNNLAERVRAGRGDTGEDSMMPYQAASGNSVVLTSNIASTSNVRSTTGVNLTPNGIGMSGVAQGKDRRIMQMSKRVQLLKGQTAAKLSAANGRLETSKVEASGDPVYVARGGDLYDEDDIEIIGGAELADDALTWGGQGNGASHRRGSSSSTSHSGEMVVDAEAESETSDGQVDEDYGEPYRESMDDQARQKVLAILQAAKAPARLTGYQRRELKRARSMGFRIERVNPNPPVKPGYCENCRVKYEDFDTHIKGRRHRKFAENAANFGEVDEFLLRVRRVPKGLAGTSVDAMTDDT